MTVCSDRATGRRTLFADIIGPGPDVSAAQFATITCADDRGREHAYGVADTTTTLDINDAPRKGDALERHPGEGLGGAAAASYPSGSAVRARTAEPRA